MQRTRIQSHEGVALRGLEGFDARRAQYMTTWKSVLRDLFQTTEAGSVTDIRGG